MNPDNNSSLNGEEQSPGLRPLINKYLPFWPLYAGLLVLSLIAVALYLRLTMPMYGSTASILLKDQNKGEEETKLEQVLNLLDNKNIIENQIEVIKSNNVLQEVARTLNMMTPVFREGGLWQMEKTLAWNTSPVSVRVRNSDSILPAEKIYFTISAPDSSVVIESKKYPMNQWVSTPWGVLQFYNNPNYKKPDDNAHYKGWSYYFSIYPLNDATQLLAANFKAAALNKQNTVVKLTINDPSKERGETIIREIVRQYYRSNIDKKNRIAENTIKFIDERMNQIGGELSQLENNLQNYRTSTGSIDVGQQGQLYLQRIEENDKQLNALYIQKTSLDELEQYVNSKGTQESIAPSVFSTGDPTLNKLVENLYTAETKYTTMKSTVAKNNPLLLSVKEDIENTRSKILDNIKNQRQNLAASQRQLQGSVSRYSSMLNTIPKKEKDLVEVTRDMNTKRDIYSFLLQKREEISYSMNSNFEDAYYVDNPTSTPLPISPNRKLAYLIGALLPLLLGSGIVSLKEAMSGKVLYQKDIENLTRFPIVGDLNFSKIDNQIPLAKSDDDLLSEQFRFIRNSYKHLIRVGSRNPKRILVTSSIEGEGKSFFSCNFAISLAKTGKRVILMEMDFYHPQVGESFGMTADKGVIDFISDQATLKELVLPVESIPNLFVALSGNMKEGASELLANGKIEGLFEVLERDFDIIIIDSPPLKAISDALVLAPKSNLILYVVRHNVTPKQVLKDLDKDMSKYRIKNLAIVFNGVKKRGFGNYGYGYGYTSDIKHSYDRYTKKRKKSAS